MELLEATYHIDAEGEAALALAEALLLEQTVEVPAPVARRHPSVREHMMGSIREMKPGTDGRGLQVTFSLPVVTASTNVAQFLNVLFGNASLHERVTLEDFALASSVRALFDGPRFGIDGLRAATGVRDRPLTCTALKPAGLPLDNLTQLCDAFARGGIDLIKDDHYLADQPQHPFAERVHTCQRAVREAAAAAGQRVLYAPHLSGTPEEVRQQADLAQEAGVGAVLAAPMLLGLPFFHELVARRLEVPVLAHPSFAGAARIRPAALLGRLFRLFGADAVIFAGYGGRFSYPQGVCSAIAEGLRADWHGLRPAFPVPAGGMTVERVPELIAFYGRDTVLLIGSDLLQAGEALPERTRAFTRRVARAALTWND